jgi:hypothetical protein
LNRIQNRLPEQLIGHAWPGHGDDKVAMDKGQDPYIIKFHKGPRIRHAETPAVATAQSVWTRHSTFQ